MFAAWLWDTARLKKESTTAAQAVETKRAAFISSKSFSSCGLSWLLFVSGDVIFSPAHSAWGVRRFLLCFSQGVHLAAVEATK